MANPTNKTKDSFVPKEVDIKTVNVFFDGTKNNMFNTDVYDENEHSDTSSYANAYSNIAHLFSYRNENNGQFWVYIEGIGTRRGDTNDEVAGYATGVGVTGVAQRAEQAFGAIEAAVVNKPSIIHINVFGFSRGAATARHFVHLAKSNPSLFRRWKLRSNQIKFKFVGLFDTVSSVGANFNNDVEELKLDFRDLSTTDKAFTKVFHIIAADEYRLNFSVTNINSAIRSGFGYEVTINGAHADVGGAYNNLTSERYSTLSNQEKNWLVDKNFYTSNKDELNSQSMGRGQFNHIFTRTGIKNDIHKVSLQMMARMSIKYGKLEFSTGEKGLSNYYNEVTGAVKTLMTNLPSDVINADPWKNGAKRGRRITKTLPENAATKALRHNYIHWSAQNAIGFEVRLKSGIPFRQIING